MLHNKKFQQNRDSNRDNYLIDHIFVLNTRAIAISPPFAILPRITALLHLGGGNRARSSVLYSVFSDFFFDNFFLFNSKQLGLQPNGQTQG